MKREKVVNLFFIISCASLIVLVIYFFYGVGRELFSHKKFFKSMHGYFAIEVINETSKDFTVNLIDNEESEILESSSVDAMNRLTIISRPSENSYQLTFIDPEQREIEIELYVSSLPTHRYQIRLVNGGGIKVEIVKNGTSTLEGYQKIIIEE